MIGQKFYKENFNQEGYMVCAKWCNETQEGIIVDKGEYFECVEVAPYIPTLEELQKQYTDFVQNIIDDKAHEKGYDNGFAVCSYALSTNPKFRGEAEAFIPWRDEVWSVCYDILDKALANEKYNSEWENVLPTDTELINALPTLDW